MDTQRASAVDFDITMYLTDHTETERKAWDKARLVEEYNIQIDGDLPDGHVLREPITTSMVVWADGTHAISGRFALHGTSAHGLDKAIARYKGFLVYRLQYLAVHNCAAYWSHARFRRATHKGVDYWIQVDNLDPVGSCGACEELEYLRSVIARKDESNT